MALSSSDVVALTSVAASALIATVTVLAGGLTARGQRRHDARQAFEARAWERKVDAHLELIKAIIKVQEAAVSQPDWGDILHLSSAREKVIGDIQPTLVAYASTACLTDLERWLSALDSALKNREAAIKRMNKALDDIRFLGPDVVGKSQDLGRKVVMPYVEKFLATTADVSAAPIGNIEELQESSRRILTTARQSLKGMP